VIINVSLSIFLYNFTTVKILNYSKILRNHAMKSHEVLENKICKNIADKVLCKLYRSITKDYQLKVFL